MRIEAATRVSRALFSDLLVRKRDSRVVATHVLRYPGDLVNPNILRSSILAWHEPSPNLRRSIRPVSWPTSGTE